MLFSACVFYSRLMVGDQVAPAQLHWISGVQSNFKDAYKLWPFLSSWTSSWNWFRGGEVEELCVEG